MFFFFSYYPFEPWNEDAFIVDMPTTTSHSGPSVLGAPFRKAGCRDVEGHVRYGYAAAVQIVAVRADGRKRGRVAVRVEKPQLLRRPGVDFFNAA